MVEFKLKERASGYSDFDYYVEGRQHDHGVFRYFEEGPTWVAIEPAPGDYGSIYSNHIGNSFVREGIQEKGIIAWY